ncbi:MULTISPECIES: RNA polymerase sigma factor [unclassified Rathayibacter]|jgi:RNA polymerase sigma-70 factor (ECF subfamily)|uniref:RNA polymerase sigma factor n=1 Tax=unclassified Rathayibacter TaxID=2609250 RepID=UPI000CE7BEFA|nr:MULTISPECIES: RNA polymerase sigma factor [unclassified Rathayibacter]PPF46354.1 RNA polymerase subunit sigma-24 [Rathayibacter sp. AY1A1]PPH01847.1 RNA polymerase subunit sigma-24 [Rathayibacter sp. AY1F6]PPI28005.1 RNA polymerase subunit sigma-24 [Rathayibacter sp. AY1B4]
MIRTDEAAAWARASSGDGEAFASIFDEHRARVFRHAYRLLVDATDAEDAVAVAFLELWRRRRSVEVINGSVLPWLLVTVTNTARNLSRGRNRYRALLTSLPHGDHQPSAEDAALRDVIDDRQLAKALGRLSPADLRLVTLVMIEGYSPTDAAPLLGLSAGATRTRLHRVRAALRDQLGHPTLSLYVQSTLGDPS